MGYQQINNEEDETITSKEAYSTKGWKVQIGDPNKVSSSRGFRVELLAPSSKDGVYGCMFLISIVGLLVGLLIRFLGKEDSVINAGSVTTIITASFFGLTLALTHGGTTLSYRNTYFYKRYITKHANISIVDWRAIPVEFQEHFSLLMNVYYTKAVTPDGAKNLSFQEKERSTRETAIMIALCALFTLVGLAFLALSVLMIFYAIVFIIGDKVGVALAGVLLCFAGSGVFFTSIKVCWSVWQRSYLVQTSEIEIDFCTENGNKTIFGVIKPITKV